MPETDPPSVAPSPPIPLPPEAERRLREIGDDPTDQRIRRAVLLGTSFAGPIPPPEVLREYRQVVPELPERIVGWTEIQLQHRHALERQAADAAERLRNRGQVISGGLAAMGLALAGAVGIWGNPFVAATLAIVAVGGPTAAFILARALPPGRADARARSQDL